MLSTISRNNGDNLPQEVHQKIQKSNPNGKTEISRETKNIRER